MSRDTEFIYHLEINQSGSAKNFGRIFIENYLEVLFSRNETHFLRFYSETNPTHTPEPKLPL